MAEDLTAGRCESDNHADTCCLGANFRPIAFTGEVTSVRGFADSLQEIQNVPICSAATVWTNPKTGQQFLLIVNQGLWFGRDLPNSLLNPNQIRFNGLDLCDDPFDPHRPVGIRVPADDDLCDTVQFIPFQFQSFAFFDTHKPTEEDLRTLPRLVLTSDATWNPSEVDLLSPLKAEESLQHVTVNSTSSSSSHLQTNVPPSIHEYDFLLEDAFHEQRFCDRLVAAVNVSQEEVRQSRLISSSATSNTRHWKGSSSEIQKRFRIPDTLARLTLQNTTQHYRRTAEGPLSRRYKTDFPGSDYRRLNLELYGDVFYSKVKSLKGNTCSFLFTDGRGFAKHFPNDNHRATTAAESYRTLVKDVGIPRTLRVDGGGEYVGKAFKKEVNSTRCKLKFTEPYSPWQNEAERDIGDLKKRWDLLRNEKNVPSRLWDYGITDILERRSRTARKFRDEWTTPLARVTGDVPDISEYVDFGFFDLVYFWEGPKKQDKEKIGWWLGVAEDVGNYLCYYVLDPNGEVKPRTTVQNIPKDDLLKPSIQERVKEADRRMRERLDDANHQVNVPEGIENVLQELHDTTDADWVDLDKLYEMDKEKERLREEGFTPEEVDELIGAHVRLPEGTTFSEWRVAKRRRDEHGNPVGLRNPISTEDTREYILENVEDGRTAEYAANTVIENMFAQVDGQGRKELLLDEIVDHRKDMSALSKDQATDRSRNGNVHHKKTTRGWYLQVKWKDDSTNWIPLSELKEANPIEVAEYAVSNQIAEEPAFVWWVHDVLRQRHRIINKVKSRYWKTTQKFGIELPKSVEDAYELDRKNGNTFWRDAIAKEMARVIQAFEPHANITPEDVRKGRYQPLLGFQEMKCHMIFDIKMDGKFTRKARLVAGGHMVEAPVAITYSSVVSRDSVRIAFLIAALNDLEVYAADVTNAYINADTAEKVWCVAGPEFGHQAGVVMKIVKALYGLSSSGACWSRELSDTLHKMGFTSSKADANVWMRPAVRKVKDSNGNEIEHEYYEYLLVYVDDLLLVSHNPTPTFTAVMEHYDLKGDKFEKPDRYLGANIEEFEFDDGHKAWSMSSYDYVRSACDVVKGLAEKHGYKMRKVDRPMPQSYRAELDTTPECNAKETSVYQQLIGMLRWATELGRIDILYEVLILSQYNACPRRGHLERAFEIFAFLSTHSRSRIVFDWQPVELDRNAMEYDWKDFYRDAKEAVPQNAPKPRGKAVQMYCFVDADHAGNSVTRRSHTGFIIFLNGAPIVWYSKRQNTVEASTFGSEFNAMHVALEHVESLRYKLRMLGIPIDGPCDMFCDNNAVVQNSQAPHSTLQKKHNSISYHRVREAVAGGTILVHKESTDTNVADLLTKLLPWPKRKRHCEALTF